MRAKADRLRRLSPAERTYLAQATVLMPAIAASLRLRGFRPTYRWLEARTPDPSEASRGETKRAVILSETSEMVEIVARKHPVFRATCLPQSMMLWHLLQRQGVAADLCIGVNRADGEFKAHAWVEHDGTVINDAPDVAERYLPVESLSGALRKL